MLVLFGIFWRNRVFSFKSKIKYFSCALNCMFQMLLCTQKSLHVIEHLLRSDTPDIAPLVLHHCTNLQKTQHFESASLKAKASKVIYLPYFLSLDVFLLLLFKVFWNKDFWRRVGW